jgi:hypothetical protein
MNMYVCLVVAVDGATQEPLAYSEVVIAESEQDALEKARVKIARAECVSEVKGLLVERSFAKEIDRALIAQAAVAVLGWLPDNDESVRDEAGGMMSRVGSPGDVLDADSPHNQ